jgi:phage terminase large subunit-like protein
VRREDSIWWSNGFTKEWWASLDKDGRTAFLEALAPEEIESFSTDWRVWGRDNQLAPDGDDNWETWVILAGRGFGKSRTGSEHVRNWVERDGIRRLCLLGQGEDDVREVMIEGESGIIACSPAEWRPKFYPSVGCGHLIWPNGAVAFVYSAADPEALRGPQFQKAWVDEPMAFNPEAREKAISNLEMGLRLGPNPQIIYTTTPKPHRWLRELREKGKTDTGIRFTKGSTYDNADNLSPKFIKKVTKNFGGTSLGRQELYADELGDEEGALFTPANLDKFRVLPPVHLITDEHACYEWARKFARTCDRVAVGVDPNTSSSKTAHAAGVVVVGLKGGRRYALWDASVDGGPLTWGKAAVVAFEDFMADEIVAEVNQGGDMVKVLIEQIAKERETDVKVVKVRAWRGKQRRAEPIGASYEQGKCSHTMPVGHEEQPGPFYKLERQMCALHDGFDPTGEDYDRADALVYAMIRLARKDGDDSTDDAGAVFTFDNFRTAEAA